MLLTSTFATLLLQIQLVIHFVPAVDLDKQLFVNVFPFRTLHDDGSFVLDRQSTVVTLIGLTVPSTLMGIMLFLFAVHVAIRLRSPLLSSILHLCFVAFPW